MTETNKITPAPITDEMQRAYLDYAMSVIVSRALPDVRDGLKPVQRRIIYAMYDQGITSSSRYQKCAAVVGEVLKKYHPHGDTSVYDALVRMAQDFTLRYPLIDGQGNFGSVDGDSPAAMRYTECRLHKISNELLRDIDKDTVNFVYNYSGDYKEPELLPAVIPNILLNGALGIAVGMATSIPPHNIKEVIDALIETIKKADEKSVETFNSLVTNEELMEYIQGPDFPTGGIIYNQKEIAQAYATGKGKILMRAKVEIEEYKKGKYAIIVNEIPYQVNKADLIERIANLVRSKKIEGISDLRDETDRRGLRIVIELKKDSRPQRILNLLFKYTDLQKTFNANFVALIDNEPKVMSLKSILEEFVRHRQRVVIRRSKYLLKKAQEREHILQGLKIALDHIDEVINTIRSSKDANQARVKLMQKFKLSELQANAILEMQLRRLAALERQKVEDELKEVIHTIKDLKSILKSRKRILEIIKQEFAEIKEKYGDNRKTKVVKGDVNEPEEEELIAKEDVLVSLTKSGYIKRQKKDTYKRQGRGGKGVRGSNLKEEDVVEQVISTNTHDLMFAFTNKGKVYSKRVWDIPEASRTSRGTAIINLLNLEPNEKVTAILAIPSTLLSSSKEFYILMTTKHGIVKKTPLLEFEHIRSTGIRCINLGKEDTLEWAHLISKNDIIQITSAKGMSIKFLEKDIRQMGRLAAGVRGIKLRKGDIVVGASVMQNGKKLTIADDVYLLTISSNGYGKKTKISKYKTQKRGGIGILTYKVTQKTGNLVASRIVNSQVKDLLITSKNGQNIRLELKSVPSLGRATQGVRLIRLNKDDNVASITPLF